MIEKFKCRTCKKWSREIDSGSPPPSNNYGRCSDETNGAKSPPGPIYSEWSGDSPYYLRADMGCEKNWAPKERSKP